MFSFTPARPSLVVSFPVHLGFTEQCSAVYQAVFTELRQNTQVLGHQADMQQSPDHLFLHLPLPECISSSGQGDRQPVLTLLLLDGHDLWLLAKNVECCLLLQVMEKDMEEEDNNENNKGV